MAAVAPDRTDAPEALFARYRDRHDLAALGRLFDALSPELFRVAVSFAGDPVLAEEALQETWIHAITAPAGFDASRPLVPWLVGILKNKVNEGRRRERRRPDPRRLAPGGAGEEAAGEATRHEDRERARAAIDALEEPYRSVALLRFVYGMEPAEIADVRGEPPSTTRSTLARALARVRASVRVLPAVFAGVGVPSGLAAVREAVLDAARRAPHATPGPGATPAGVAARASTLLNRPLAAVAAALLLVGGAAVALWAARGSDPSDAAPSAESGAAPGAAGLRVAQGAGGAPPVGAPAPAGSAAPTSGGPKDSVRGKVLDSEGTPIGGARVVLKHGWDGDAAAAGAPAATTDATGSFEVRASRRQDWIAVASAEGMTTEEAWVGSRGVAEIRLWRASPIAGRVVDADDGAPVPFARIRAQAGARYHEGVRPWNRTVQAGADGRYEMPDAPVGRVRLQASSARHAPTIVVVETAGGQALVRDLAVAAGCRVEGLVSRERTPVPGALVQAYWRDDPPGGIEATTDERGRFVAALGPGRWSLTAAGPHERGWASAEISVPADARTLRVDFALQDRRALLEGRVLVRGAPAPGAEVKCRKAEGRTDDTGRFRLEIPDYEESVPVRARVEGVGATEVQVARAEFGSLEIDVPLWGRVTGRLRIDDGRIPRGAGIQLDEHGDYVATVTEQGDYELLVKPGKWVVRGWGEGRPASREVTIDVAPGAVVTGVDITWPVGRSVRGVVVDDRGVPLPRVQVAVALVGRVEYQGREVTTDDRGRFSLENVDVDEIQLTAGGSQGFPGAAPMTFRVGIDDVRLVVARDRRALRGRVLRPDGRPVTTFGLVLFSEPHGAEPSPIEQFRFVDPDGRFEVDRIPGDDGTGRYGLSASCQDSVSARVGGLTRSESGADVVLVVEPGGYVSGRVTTRDGTPIRWAKVRPIALAGWYSRTETDVTGSYRIGPFAPGPRELSVSGASGLLWLGTKRISPSVEAGETTVSDVTLTFGGDAVVWVADAAGRAVAGATAEFLDAAGAVLPVDKERTSVNGPRPYVLEAAQTTSDAEGRVHRRFLPPETRRVRVAKTGYRAFEAEVAVVDEGTVEVRAVLAEDGGPSGR